MNILKKELAPLSGAAWEEIGTRADEIFKTHLTARRFVDIDGPHGLESAGISTGRIVIRDDQSSSGVNYGIREFQPFIEVRKPFELKIWELDNLSRGAKDPDLEPLEKAAMEMGDFEEQVIYRGLKDVGIEGIVKSSEHEKAKLGTDPEEMLKSVIRQMMNLQQTGVEGPYDLVLDVRHWERMMNTNQSLPMKEHLQSIIGGRLIVHPGNRASLLVSRRGGDLELVLGQDLSIGYDWHDTEKVKLFFAESFTFRILGPEAFIVF